MMSCGAAPSALYPNRERPPTFAGGLAWHGPGFVDDVMRRGAVGVISESEAPADFQGAWIQVSNARSALAQAAAIINDNPSHKLKLVGITGTNGKTTTTYLT